jgi:geranylgeranyl pyrophosphate synthase
MESTVSRIIEQKLLEPASELDLRPRKNFRAHLVEIGFDLAGSKTATGNHTQTFSEIIECLHTGSLIIDDVQDNSTVRRGGPCVHQVHGVPLAINAGNWLYFSAMDRVAKTASLSDSQKSQTFSAISEALMKAHVGQALDLGANLLDLRPEEVPLICERSLQWKSGQLAGLAFQLGAIAALAAPALQSVVFDFGARFGTLLQKFDDIGNLNVESGSEKHLEDLTLLRPSWVWACLYTHFSAKDVRAFKLAVSELPATLLLRQFLAHSQLRTVATNLALSELETWTTEIIQRFHLQRSSQLKILQLGEHLKDAYT